MDKVTSKKAKMTKETKGLRNIKQDYNDRETSKKKGRRKKQEGRQGGVNNVKENV